MHIKILRIEKKIITGKVKSNLINMIARNKEIKNLVKLKMADLRNLKISLHVFFVQKQNFSENIYIHIYTCSSDCSSCIQLFSGYRDRAG